MNVHGFTMILVVASLALQSAATDTPAQGGQQKANHILPWEIIADGFSRSHRFCSQITSDNVTIAQKDNSTANSSRIGANYVFKPRQAVTYQLSEGIFDSRSLHEAKINIAQQKQGSWQNIDTVTAAVNVNIVTLPGGISVDGFFRLTVVTSGSSGKQQHFNVYAIVSENWKKDILIFLRNWKHAIESNPDPQLVYSSIAVSHIDHAMDVVGKAPYLSPNILQILANTTKAKRAFEAGECPDLVIGSLNRIRLKRFAGAPVTVFDIYVPKNYDNTRQWPLYINIANIPANISASLHEGTIPLWGFGSTETVQRKIYYTFLTIIKAKLNIDENRIHLYGACSGGVYAMDLALHYPDQWTEVNIDLGNSYQQLAGNALNLNIHFYQQAHLGKPQFVAWYDFMAKCFKYYGCESVNTDKPGGIGQNILPQLTRMRSPERVLFTADSLQTAKAYWAKIEGRGDENLPATIDASVTTSFRGQSISIKTNNVDAYNLDLANAPVNLHWPVMIVENGRNLGFTSEAVFVKRSKKYDGAKYIKNDYLSGPITDAFTDPYVLVYGCSGNDTELIESSKALAESLSNGAPYCSDTEMPHEMIASHNLILIGTAESNLLLAKIHKDLPLQTNNGQIAANGKIYKGDIGCCLIYPNPMNPKRYVVVFSGTTAKAIKQMPTILDDLKSMPPADVCVFEITQADDIKWHISEKFNTVWNWHEQWDQVLAMIAKPHANWQWHQWVAGVVRKQLKADVAIFADPFRFSDMTLAGEITCRDLFNRFTNDWIIKIKLKGKSLRQLLMVPFADISKRQKASLVAEGISYSRQKDDGSSILNVADIELDKQYTIACPYHLILWDNLGLTLKDYQLLDDGNLVPILKEYLRNNYDKNLDTALDGMKPNAL